MFASNSLFMWHIWTIAQHAGPNHLGLWVANQGEREDQVIGLVIGEDHRRRKGSLQVVELPFSTCAADRLLYS